MPDPRFFDYSLGPSERLEEKVVPVVPDGPSWLLRGGTVLDGRGGRRKASVLVRGERIADVLEDDREVPGARVLDCSGATVLPGMFDLHVHLMGTSEHDRALSHLRPHLGLRAIRLGFEAYHLLAHGFTTILDLGHGDAEHVYGVREAIAEGVLRGPRILNVGWYLAPSHESESNLPHVLDRELRITQHVAVNGREEITELLRANAADGAEWTKFYFTPEVRPGEPHYTEEELRQLVTVSHRLGMPVACHAKTVAAVRAAIEAGVDCIEHGPDVVDRELLEVMAERRTALVPTLAVYDRVAVVAEEFAYPQQRVDAIRRELEGRMRNVQMARELGVRIGVGSDVGARGGFGALSARELTLLGQCGFGPMEAIVAATSVSAEILGVSADLGTIETGKLAEMVVVEGDPLSGVDVFQRPSAIRHVFQAAHRLGPMDLGPLGYTPRLGL